MAHLQNKTPLVAGCYLLVKIQIAKMNTVFDKPKLVALALFVVPWDKFEENLAIVF